MAVNENPQYMFTYMKRGTMEVPIVRIKSESERDTRLEIGKHYEIIIEQQDVIFDYNFVVKNSIKFEETGGIYYSWYQLEYLSKSADYSPSVKLAAEQNSANIDYISMMSGIDLPTDNKEELINE